MRLWALLEATPIATSGSFRGVPGSFMVAAHVTLVRMARMEDCTVNKPIDHFQGRPIVAHRGGLTVTRVGAYLGAEITGIDLRKPISDEVRAAIEHALAENELIIFRNQDISSGNLMEFGRRFGELTVHPFAPRDETASVLIKFRNDETNPPFRTDVWHSDETFRKEPPTATILVAKEVPAIGGDTMFASMSAAFDGLSDRMRHFISGLEAVHDFKPFRELFDDSEEDRKNVMRWEQLYPPAVHPVVRVHPVTGRKVLFVNPQFTVAIKNMDERESKSLLDILFQQAQIPEYQFRHHWAPHTLIMWDNRSTQHYAVNDYFPQRRYMERVTIKGGPVTGVERADPENVRKAIRRTADRPPSAHGKPKAPITPETAKV
jgi:taurine dioxygenase